jgi:MinD-like ATPase involved in chromosome partitioning or flagellar assembly
VPRAAVAVVLPHPESVTVCRYLADAGFEAIPVESADELERLLGSRDDVHLAIIDGETDLDRALEMYPLLHDGGRDIATLMLVLPRTLGRMGAGSAGTARDEYFTRPYALESLRWRVEAMLIRVENWPADGLARTPLASSAESPIIEEQALIGGQGQAEASPTGGKIVIVFNPKGGVGKTTISINVGAMLQIRKGRRVLLVDCDTITGHIAQSLGLERPRTLADAWRESAILGAAGSGTVFAAKSVAEIAAVHGSGVGVLVMAESPLHTEILDPKRVADAIGEARASYDYVILDMHPDYGPLNQALFNQADRILIPVTPDVPCIRAAVQFREIAEELNLRDRLSLVINRAKSGVSASDVERVVSLPALARIRSAGMLFVRAADEGKSAVERFPTAKVVDDIDRLADRLIEVTHPNAGTRQGLLSRGRIGGSFKGLFDRIMAQVF